MKTKNYKVLVTAYAVVLVKNAASEEAALEAATDDLDLGICEMDTAKIEKEVIDLTVEERNGKQFGGIVVDASD